MNVSSGEDFFNYVTTADMFGKKVIGGLEKEMYDVVKKDIIDGYEEFSAANLDPNLLQRTIVIAHK